MRLLERKHKFMHRYWHTSYVFFQMFLLYRQMFSPLSGWWKEFYVYGKMKANKSAEVFCDFFFFMGTYIYLMMILFTQSSYHLWKPLMLQTSQRKKFCFISSVFFHQHKNLWSHKKVLNIYFKIRFSLINNKMKEQL